jgi:hypothetical protein
VIQHVREKFSCRAVMIPIPSGARVWLAAVEQLQGEKLGISGNERV